MVTTEVAQLSQECNAWRETLRSFRDEFHQMKQQLQEKAKGHTHKEDLLQVEHLDNQLHIQLINIHDLKQAIKQHDKKVLLEVAQNESGISESTLLDHERLLILTRVLITLCKTSDTSTTSSRTERNSPNFTVLLLHVATTGFTTVTGFFFS